jgi:hypothetical protein
MAALGAAQGLALWWVADLWPEDRNGMAPLTAAIWAIVSSGFVLHFAPGDRSLRRLLALAGAIGLAFGAVALWVAGQLPTEPSESQGDGARIWSWALASAAALFVLGPFLQIHLETRRLRFPYADLYRWSWRNFFVFALGAAVALVFWLVLKLWGALFGLLGIGVFEDAFGSWLFAAPATGAAFAYGLVVARERGPVLDALIGITQALFRALLSLVSLVSLAFLASLPVTGLAPLFATSSAATLLIGWLAVHILLFNAVYLDGASAPPHAPALLRLFEAGALALPVFGGIACYAVGLRIAQYGLTPDRCWAAVSAAILSGYGVGYAFAVATRGAPWLPAVRGVNVVMSVVVIALAFALHTPLADPLRLSLSSQLARLEDGRVRPAEFDFKTLRFGLGQQGLAALDRLAGSALNEEVRSRARLALGASSRWDEPRDPNARPELFTIVPQARAWPEGLLDRLHTEAGDQNWAQFCVRCYVVSADLDGDGSAEEIVVPPHQGFMVAYARDPESKAWIRVARAEHKYLSDDEVEALVRGEFETAPAALRDLRVGERRISFRRE